MSSATTGTKAPYADAVRQAIDGVRQELVDISLDIHAHPETNYQEHHAAKLLSDALERHGFKVERGVGGVETAFRGTLEGGAGDGPTIALLCEYDALPDVGHGCGHNLIAISNLGAGLGVKAALQSLPGRLVVLGTPAEEGGGGKVRLLEAGVFKGIDVSLSSHPGGNRSMIFAEAPISESTMLAMVGYRYIFHGKAAHAAANPQEGINALNAVIHLCTGIDAMRQHLKDDVRIHGYISDGGKAANVVPDYAAANFMLRSRDHVYLRDTVVDKVRQIAEGAALVTGARLEVQDYYPFYENVRPSNTLAKAARINADVVGMHIDEPPPGGSRASASTDFGNVSQVMPAYYLSFTASEKQVSMHTVQMAEAAKSDLTQESALNTAKVLALTTCDLLADPDLLAGAREEFSARQKQQ